VCDAPIQYIVIIESVDRSTCWFCTPPMAIGLGSDPAGITRSFAARICAERPASDGLTSIAAWTTASGLFQSNAIAGGARAITTINKKCFIKSSNRKCKSARTSTKLITREEFGDSGLDEEGGVK